MANTFSEIHIQFIFAVKYSDGIIGQSWEGRLYEYMTGIVQKYDHKVLAINGTPDHVHILVTMRPKQAPSDLMEAVKGSASQWINEKQFLKTKFAWQDGFSAYSYTKSDVPKVIAHIENQKEFHKTVSFLDEYRAILTRFNIPFEERYIFKPLE